MAASKKIFLVILKYVISQVTKINFILKIKNKYVSFINLLISFNKILERVKIENEGNIFKNFKFFSCDRTLK